MPKRKTVSSPFDPGLSSPEETVAELRAQDQRQALAREHLAAHREAEEQQDAAQQTAEGERRQLLSAVDREREGALRFLASPDAAKQERDRINAWIASTTRQGVGRAYEPPPSEQSLCRAPHLGSPARGGPLDYRSR